MIKLHHPDPTVLHIEKNPTETTNNSMDYTSMSIHQCVLCRKETETFNEIKFSDNFTTWSLLGTGDCICDTCNNIKNDGKYRKSSWIMEDGKTTFFKRENILDVLQQKKQTPFFIYVTESFKKLGYLNILHRPNFNEEKFVVAFDHDVIIIDKKELDELVLIAKKAKELKFSKTEMLNGPHTKHWEDREFCESIMKIKHKPVWRLIVFGI